MTFPTCDTEGHYKELSRGKRIPVISDFIDNEIVRLADYKIPYGEVNPPLGPLNSLFKSVLDTDVYLPTNIEIKYKDPHNE